MAYRIPFRGELDLDQLELALAALERMVNPRLRLDVVFDCSAMQGYTSDARNRFVEWHRTHKGTVGHVAIVTDKALWQMVISTMSLASGRSMRSFTELEHARVWLGHIEDLLPN